jgi:hypothetical protein
MQGERKGNTEKGPELKNSNQQKTRKKTRKLETEK